MRASIIAAVAAIAVPALAADSAGYLKLDLNRRSNPNYRRLVRRQNQDGSVDAQLTQNTNKLEYLVNITVGTPVQHMAVTLDTGSSDLWVPAVSSNPCTKGECDAGAFDPTQSTSYNVVDQGGFNITYAGPGDSDAGDWSTDTITVGGSPQITKQLFGVALDGYDNHGVMGIGFDTNESPNPSESGVYKSTVDNMVDQGLIQRKAYSLYLNDLAATQGAVIFGGVDTTKYTGDLVALPLQLGPTGMISEFYVTLTNVTFTDHAGAITQLSPDGYAQATLLDSGTSGTFLTNDVFEPLAKGFGAVTVQDDVYAVPCSYANVKGSINYSFGGQGGVTIDVPISQVIGSQIFPSDQFNDASGGCDFGFGPPLQGVSVLGDTFLRSAYAVYDLDNQNAALAQAAENKADTSSINVMASGTDIPGATITATATATQLSGSDATDPPDVPTVSGEGSTAYAGTPTFNLGATPTGGSVSSSSSGAAFAAAPTAALLGFGLAAGAFAW